MGESYRLNREGIFIEARKILDFYMKENNCANIAQKASPISSSNTNNNGKSKQIDKYKALFTKPSASKTK